MVQMAVAFMQSHLILSLVLLGILLLLYVVLRLRDNQDETWPEDSYGNPAKYIHPLTGVGLDEPYFNPERPELCHPATWHRLPKEVEEELIRKCQGKK